MRRGDHNKIRHTDDQDFSQNRSYEQFCEEEKNYFLKLSFQMNNARSRKKCGLYFGNRDLFYFLRSLKSSSPNIEKIWISEYI